MKAHTDELSEKKREKELAFWLAFAKLSGPGLGTKRVLRLQDRFGSLSAAWQADANDLSEIGALSPDMIQKFKDKRREIDPERLLADVKKAGVQAYYLYDPHYPSRLREIFDPPLVIFVQGQLHPDDWLHTFAIVGTRRPTSYGTRQAKEIAIGLAQSGATIVSGMAVGIDSLAHWAAIEAGGRTLAVLGCGIDICYPSSNKPLFKLLAEGEKGALISEYFPGTEPETWMFPARNRIISGLCQGLVVVEAGETSGSLITAELAFDQSRDVFAVPGRLDAPFSKGTNKLIKENKAHFIISYKDILDHYGLVSTPPYRTVPTLVELYGREREIFEFISAEPVHFDVLCQKSGMAAGELSATLTMLELAGVVQRLPGDWYERQKAVTISD